MLNDVSITPCHHFQIRDWRLTCSRRSESGERREEQGNGAENSDRKKAGK